MIYNNIQYVQYFNYKMANFTLLFIYDLFLDSPLVQTSKFTNQ